MDINDKGLLALIVKRLRDLRVDFTTLSKQPGPPGNQGERGPRGLPGPEGQAGADGKNGIDGTDGTPGRDGANGADGIAGKDGNPGEPGTDGAMGPMPQHQWKGTKLRFQQTAARWGKWVDLRTGKSSSIVVGSTGSDFDPSSLPTASDTPDPTEVIVKQNGVWVRASWVQFTGWIGSVTPPVGVTVNGVSVTVEGETVLVNGA